MNTYIEALYKLEVLGQKKGKKKGYYIEKLIQLLEVWNNDYSWL